MRAVCAWVGPGHHLCQMPAEGEQEEVEGEAKDGEAAPSDPPPEDDGKCKPCVKLLCIGRGQQGARGGGGSATEAPIRGYGIIQRHAYSVVGLKEAAGYRLVRIRNPWGTGEWTGPWSDQVGGWGWVGRRSVGSGTMGCLPWVTCGGVFGWGAAGCVCECTTAGVDPGARSWLQAVGGVFCVG
jgi:hypothetical protein